MHYQNLLFLACIISIFSFSIAFTPPGLFRKNPPAIDHHREDYQHRNLDTQTPMNPGPVQPPERDPEKPTGDGALTISDVLPKLAASTFFASLTRDIPSVTDRLESAQPSDNTTLLAPLNSAMQALPRKPWEDRPDDKSDVDASRNEDKAAQNLKRFVEEHVVPTSPWKEGKNGKVKTLGGQEIWWEMIDDKRIIMPGRIEVSGVVGRVGNGEIWALKGVVNYAS